MQVPFSTVLHQGDLFVSSKEAVGVQLHLSVGTQNCNLGGNLLSIQVEVEKRVLFGKAYEHTKTITDAPLGERRLVEATPR